MTVPTMFRAVTDEMVAAARKSISETERERPACFSVMTPDVIRRWAYAIGDLNPLWLDEEYARASRWGALLAPPTFAETSVRGPVFNLGKALATTFTEADGKQLVDRMREQTISAGFPGLAGLQVGREFTFFEPVRAGEELRGTQRVSGIVDSEGRVDGDLLTPEAEVETALAAAADECAAVDTRIVIQTFDIKVYSRQSGRLLMRDLHHMARFARGITLEESKYRDVGSPPYTDEEIADIVSAHLTGFRRGSDVLYWEDVQVGDDVPTLVKGPHTPWDFIMYHCAFGGWFDVTDRAKYVLLHQHPGAGLIDPDTNVPDFPIMMHLDHFAAYSMGYPRGFDGSMQRISWFGQLMTNWIGDDGELKKLTVFHHQPLFLYDTMWIKGKVVGKDDAASTVDVELWGDNQRGATISRGRATVALQRAASRAAAR